LLHELLPKATQIAVLVNSKFPDSEDQMRDVQEAARKLGLQVRVLNASTDDDIDMRFATLAEQRADALMVAADPFFTARRSRIIALAGRHAVRFTICAIGPPLEAYSAMEPILRQRFAKLVFMPAKS
jgi:putative tryptophan/tyrosine transport system substrate-binding protein